MFSLLCTTGVPFPVPFPNGGQRREPAGKNKSARVWCRGARAQPLGTPPERPSEQNGAPEQRGPRRPERAFPFRKPSSVPSRSSPAASSLFPFSPFSQRESQRQSLPHSAWHFPQSRTFFLSFFRGSLDTCHLAIVSRQERSSRVLAEISNL